MENTLVGTKVLKKVTYQIEITGLSSEVPNEEIPEFIPWLQSVAIENGLGKHVEHYAYTENREDDIATSFFVKRK